MIVELMSVDVTAYAQAAVVGFEKLLSPQWYVANWPALFQIIMIDVVLAGDNAIVVGLAASRVAPEIRNKVIFWGITAAVVLRIFFAVITVQLLEIIFITLAGGILLLWVCWKMYREIITDESGQIAQVEAGLAAKTAPTNAVGFWPAVWTIILADVSMSLDNVLAVAGAAKGEPLVLVLGLAIAIVLMAIAAHYIASLLVKYPWITWVGLLIILWVALDMIYRGSHEVTCQAFEFGCSESLIEAIFGRIGIPVPDIGIGH